MSPTEIEWAKIDSTLLDRCVFISGDVEGTAMMCHEHDLFYSLPLSVLVYLSDS